MELDITCMLDERLKDYSDSIANSGLRNIAKVTWNNALKSDISFVTNESIKEVREYLSTFGAWSLQELNEFTLNEVNALVIQLVSGDLQEYLEAKQGSKQEFEEWEERFGGRVYECDVEDYELYGNLFYYLGI